MPKRHRPPTSLADASGLTLAEISKLTRPRKSFRAGRSVTIPSGLVLWCCGRNGRVLHTFMAISWLMQGRRQARLSIEAISAVVGMSDRSVKYALTELVRGGWIKRRPVKTSDNRQGYSIYRIPRLSAGNLLPAGQPIAQVLVLDAEPAADADDCRPTPDANESFDANTTKEEEEPLRERA